MWEAVGAWDLTLMERSSSSSCNAFFILSLSLTLPPHGIRRVRVAATNDRWGQWWRVDEASGSRLVGSDFFNIIDGSQTDRNDRFRACPPSFSTQVSYLLLGDQTSLSKHLFSSPRCQRRARRHLDRMFVAVRLRDQHPDACKMPGQFRIRFFPH